MQHATTPRSVASSREVVLWVALVAIGACLAAISVAVANQAYFDLVNGIVGARETVARGVLFSSWLVVLAAPVVVWRPAAFGLRLGDLRQHLLLVAVICLAAMLLTGGIVKAIGGTPYADASLVIESVVVPVTEELLFRAVLLTILVAILVRVGTGAAASASAVAIDGIAFGIAHAANAASVAASFVIGQVLFASVLGMTCAALMIRTRSVIPAIVLHGIVNAVVVLV